MADRSDVNEYVFKEKLKLSIERRKHLTVPFGVVKITVKTTTDEKCLQMAGKGRL